MKKTLSLLLVVFMLLPMLAISTVSATGSAAAPAAGSFADPVSAGGEKYYTTKTLQTVDFAKIKTDAALTAAGITYLDASSSDDYGVSYVDEGLYYYSASDMGYLISDVVFDSAKSYIVDFTVKVNPSAHIFEASAAFTDKTTINGDYGSKVIDKTGALKLRLKQSNNTVSKLDNGKYYSDAACTSEIGEMLGSDAQSAIFTDKADVRVKMVFTGGTWKYCELIVDGQTYYIYYDNGFTVHTGYFGFRAVGDTQVILKNLTISEGTNVDGAYATLVSDGKIYRVAAGSEIDAGVYDKDALAIESDGFYYDKKMTAEAGKTFTLAKQTLGLFIAPMNGGTKKYYPTKNLQAVDFSTVKNAADLAAAGITYVDAMANDGYDIYHVEEGLNYYSTGNKGNLLSTVKLSSSKSYIIDYTLKANPTAHILVNSASYSSYTTVGSNSGSLLSLRMKMDNKLVIEGAKYYSDPACTAEIGKAPYAETQTAALDNKADVRVRMLIVGGVWQYSELTVEGQTYYMKATSSKSGQTGYFGFSGTGETNVIFKNFTISECSTTESAYAMVVCGANTYRVAAGSEIDAAAYSNKAIAIAEGGTCFAGKATAEAGKVYKIRFLEDIDITWAGASVRLKTDSGLRFATFVSKEDISLLDQLKAAGMIKSYSCGTLITYASYAKKVDNAITHEALDAFAKEVGINNSYVDVQATGWYADTGKDYAFVGSIVNIKEANYSRKYASAGYITVTLADDSEVTVYAEYGDVKARSVSYVAACAYYDTSVNYSDTQNTVLKAFMGDGKYYTFVTNGGCDYTVVYDADDATAKSLATEISGALLDGGIKVSVKPDTSNISGKGIYIGATSHAVSAAGKAYYINSYIGVDTSGNISVTGELEVGVAQILKRINSANTGRIDTILFDDTLFGWYVEDGFANVPKYEGAGASRATLNYTFDGYNSYFIQISGVTKEDFNNYIAKLEAEGYTREDDFTSRNGDPARAYTNGDALVSVSYVDYSSSSYTYDNIGGDVAYISIGVNTVETSGVLLRDTTGGVCELQVTLVGTECGYIIRLTNGHFVIVDGGLKENNYDFIYEQLVAQNVLDGNPVIEAWFFTHPHTDHVGAFLQFAKVYNKSVELQSVVQHVPALSRYQEDCSEGDEANSADVVTGMERNSLSVLSHLKQYFPKTKIITAYRGQRYAFAGVRFDVLFTSENLYDTKMKNTNSSSVVYQLVFSDSGKKMTILGDMYYDGCQLINLMYGNGLATDVVQVAHHGYNGGDSNMYKKINASYAFWTNSKATIDERGLLEKSNSYNHITGGVEGASGFKYHVIPTDTENSGTPVILRWGMTKADLQALGLVTPGK